MNREHLALIFILISFFALKIRGCQCRKKNTSEDYQPLEQEELWKLILLLFLHFIFISQSHIRDTTLFFKNFDGNINDVNRHFFIVHINFTLMTLIFSLMATLTTLTDTFSFGPLHHSETVKPSLYYSTEQEKGSLTWKLLTLVPSSISRKKELKKKLQKTQK